MRRFLKHYADCSERVMETGDHFKNGASLKSLMSRRNIGKGIFYVSAILFVCLIQSCAMLTLRGHHAMLNHNTTYSGADVQITTPFDPHFSIACHLGAGKLDFSKSDLSYSGMDYTSSIAPSLGLSLNYFFSAKRLQPFISVEVNDLFWYGSELEEDNKKNDANYIRNTYVTAIPKAGLRFYISKKIAVNGSLGYQFGWADIENIKQEFKGFMPSIGISFSIGSKE
jgi:hypothetical protein